ncbi:vacuolar protein sorting-associated protein, partial [Haematococcus lacustris]
MRRGPGLAGLQQDALKREQYKQIGDEVKNSNLEAMKQQMSLFKSKLEEFARKHKADIRRDPELRARFHQMCANIGVDPLASNKGLWTHALGFGDFYYELGVQIVEACLASRSADGGLLELGALTRAVNRRRGGQVDPVTSARHQGIEVFRGRLHARGHWHAAVRAQCARGAEPGQEQGARAGPEQGLCEPGADHGRLGVDQATLHGGVAGPAGRGAGSGGRWPAQHAVRAPVLVPLPKHPVSLPVIEGLTPSLHTPHPCPRYQPSLHKQA